MVHRQFAIPGFVTRRSDMSQAFQLRGDRPELARTFQFTNVNAHFLRFGIGLTSFSAFGGGASLTSDLLIRLADAWAASPLVGWEIGSVVETPVEALDNLTVDWEFATVSRILEIDSCHFDREGHITPPT